MMKWFVSWSPICILFYARFAKLSWLATSPSAIKLINFDVLLQSNGISNSAMYLIQRTKWLHSRRNESHQISQQIGRESLQLNVNVHISGLAKSRKSRYSSRRLLMNMQKDTNPGTDYKFRVINAALSSSWQWMIGSEQRLISRHVNETQVGQSWGPGNRESRVRRLDHGAPGLQMWSTGCVGWAPSQVQLCA